VRPNCGPWANAWRSELNQQLPERPDLEHLKGQAKALHKSLETGDANALARMLDLPGQAPFKLADAQLAIAREYGFPSWAALKRHVEGYADRRTAFFAALRAGDRERTRQLIETDRWLIDARDPTSFGAAPIYVAANRGDKALIDLLIDAGVDIDGRSDWWAGSFGALDSASPEISDYLLKRGATLTPHAAARLGMAPELKEMIRRDPEVVHQRGGDGQFPLHFAKTPEIVDLLVDAGADVEARDLDHNSTAAQWRVKDTPIVRRLLERGANPDIYLAISLNDLDMVKRFVEEDPEVVNRQIGDPEDTQVKPAEGGNIYIYVIGNFRPFQLAWNLGRFKIFDYLFEHASVKNQLLAACWKGDSETAKKLANDHPEIVPNLPGSDMAMIAHAAWDRRTSSVKLMAELGFDVNTQAGEADSAPIDRAGFHGFYDVIEVLLPYQPRLDIKNAFGGTPLGATLYGSIHGWRKDGNYPRCVELLLEAGAPPPKEPAGPPEVRAVLAKFGIT